MKQNWRTNLGGAVSVTGASLIGVGVLAQLSQLSSAIVLGQGQLKLMWYVALFGFVLECIGRGLTALFAADAKAVAAAHEETKELVSDLQSQINQVTGDTSRITRSSTPQPAIVPAPAVTTQIAGIVTQPKTP